MDRAAQAWLRVLFGAECAAWACLVIIHQLAPGEPPSRTHGVLSGHQAAALAGIIWVLHGVATCVAWCYDPAADVYRDTRRLPAAVACTLRDHALQGLRDAWRRRRFQWRRWWRPHAPLEY